MHNTRASYYFKIAVFCILSIVFILKSRNSYAQCAGQESYSSNPLPDASNQYGTDTTVTFCYSMNGFFQFGSNWVDGFIITLGNGWNAASLTPTLLPNSCDGDGVWGFYQSVTSSGNGGTYGPGFFYDRYNFFGSLDGDPGNDYGDYTLTGTCQWNLCFSVSVNSTCANSDLSVSITAVGDGTVGSWVNNQCSGIPFVLSTATCIAYCSGFSVDAIGTDPGCVGNDGIVTSVVNSGTAPFNYLWSNPGSTTSIINNLSSGTYIVTVSDQNNCVAVDSVSLVLHPTFTLTSSVVNAACLSYCDGSISLTPSNIGLAPFVYFWNSSLPSVPNPTNLCAGAYSVTVTDANQCTAYDTLTITEPAGMNINMIPASTTCNGGCDGSMTAIVSLGTPPYSLIWFDNSTDTFVSGLCAGPYNVSASDAHGCTLLGSGSVNQPSAIIINTNPSNVSCSGLSDGWVTFTQQNATLPYSLIWMPGGIPFDTLKNLYAGNYSITLTDFNGCTGSSNAIVTEPLPLSVTVITTPTSCPLGTDGNASALPSGGTAQYFYNWINPSGLIAPTINNLTIGYYDVIVTDSHGCTATAGNTVLSNELFTVNAFADTTIVNGNDATLGIQLSQSGNYTYSWTPIEFANYPNSFGTIVSPTSTTTYTIIVIEDGTGCINSDSVVVIVLPTTYIFVPNAFTPNNDGFNDLFQLIKGEIVNIKDVQVFNRWGQIVYRDVELNWDGNNRDGIACSFGVYAFYIVYSIKGDETTYRKEGNVTLVR